ncbi:MAG TPA: 2Fe-2S iron-sulfur cluster binding domain-containing protein [Symbiobacteriaceae bacterium]|jgi:ferredoxin
MRRIDYQGQEYLIHTRSGMRLMDAARESGVPVDCDCNHKKGESSGKCALKWPKDTQFLLTAPTELERKVLGDQMAQGYRLACQAMYK